MAFTPDYTIELNDGNKVPLLFNHWAFRTYGERKGIEYEDLAQGCFPKEDGTPGPTLRKNKLPDILLIGAECYCKYNNVQLTHSELDACLWVDELTWEQMQEIGRLFASKICRVNLDELEAKASEQQEETETAEGEKKS